MNVPRSFYGPAVGRKKNTRRPVHVSGALSITRGMMGPHGSLVTRPPGQATLGRAEDADPTPAVRIFHTQECVFIWLHFHSHSSEARSGDKSMHTSEENISSAEFTENGAEDTRLTPECEGGRVCSN